MSDKDKKDCSQENLKEEVMVLLHELSNPLTIALSLVEIMLKDPKVEKLPEVHDSLKRISKTVDKLKKINN